MSDYEIDILRRIGMQEQRLGQIYDQLFSTYVPVPALSETSGALIGGALNVGTYTVGYVGSGETYIYNYPTTSKAVVVRMSAIFSAASNSTFAYLRPTSGATEDIAIICRALVGNISSDGSGIVKLNTSGKFDIVVGGANATAFYLYILGYFL